MINIERAKQFEEYIKKYGEVETIRILVEAIDNPDSSSTTIKNAMDLLTVEDLRNYYASLPMDSNCRCIICKGSIRSSTTISKSEVIHLLELQYQCNRDGNSLKWIMYDAITSITHKHWGTKGTKTTQLSHWDLIELSSDIKKTNAIEVEDVKNGSQRLTPKGYKFLSETIQVPETVYKNQFGEPLGFSSNMIYIYDVNCKSKSNYIDKKMVVEHYNQRRLTDKLQKLSNDKFYF